MIRTRACIYIYRAPDFTISASSAVFCAGASCSPKTHKQSKRTCTDTCQLNHLPFHGKLPGAGLCQTSAHRQLAGLLCAAGLFFGVVWWFHTVIASFQGATNFRGHSGRANMQQRGFSVTSISHCCQASLSGEVPFSAKAPRRGHSCNDFCPSPA